jgi:hypothetical protein
VTAAPAVATAVVFVWLGMVVAISFLETPLKFRAPGVTLQIGLGIGRLVFRALNGCELALAAALVVCLVIASPSVAVAVVAGVAIASLLIQVVAVRPSLTRRSEATLAGGEVPRSRAHWIYVGVEIVKVAALLITGVLLLSA